MNVLNEFHLTCDVIYLMGLNDSLHPDTVQTQGYIAFCLRCRVNQKLYIQLWVTLLCLRELCAVPTGDLGWGTLCPGASGLESRLNWITAGASARRDEMASQDGYKVKKQPQRNQCLCHWVGGKINFQQLVSCWEEFCFLVEWESEGKKNPCYDARTLIISAAQSQCFTFPLNLFLRLYTLFIILGNKNNNSRF